MKSVFILTFFYIMIQININNTNGDIGILNLAKLYANKKNSDFANNEFIMKILYGHEDVPFKIEDLYYNFSINTQNYNKGNIIIGNDFHDAGIVLDDSLFLLPGASGKISIFSANSLGSYFYKGYIIKETYSYYKTFDLNVQAAKLNDSNFCKTCVGTINNRYNCSIIDLNRFWNIWIESRDSPITIFLNGYISFYDNIQKIGKINLIESQVIFPGKPYDLHLIEDNSSSFNFEYHSTYINFTIKAKIKAYQDESDLLIQGLFNLN